MKRLSKLCIILFVLIGCQNKKEDILPMPDAKYVAIIGDNNNATFTFTVNGGETYIFDFGDGTTKTETVADNANKNSIQLNHQYQTNGSFITVLSIKNKNKTVQEQKTVEAKSLVVVDFSYELLENGRVKLKNLSQNAKNGYKWLIGETSYTNNGYYFYTSNDQEPIVDIDLNGQYQIKLEAIGYSSAIKEKSISIKNAVNQMTFSGIYEGKTSNFSLDGMTFYYTCAVGGGSMSPYGLYQKLWKNSDSKEIFSKIYTLPYDPMSPQNYSKEEKYSLIRKNLTNQIDKDIIEVKEEDLNSKFYNNTVEFYPKAFWVKYKIKSSQLDGELKVRIMIYGLK